MKDYPYIRAWYCLYNMSPFLTERVVAKAVAEQAPETAVFQKDDGVWETLENVEDMETKRQIQAIVANEGWKGGRDS